MFNRRPTLDREIASIKDENIKNFVKRALEVAPAYWWTVESSKTHHPKDERGKYGRIRHAKRCVYLSEVLAESQSLTDLELDELKAASILHDICVRGSQDEQSSDKALPNHPMLIRERVISMMNDSTRRFYGQFGWYFTLYNIIETHMGKWGEKKPQTGLEKLFHIIDMIASRDQIYIEIG